MTYCTEGNINSDNPRGIHWNSLQDGFPHGQGEWKACENVPPCRIHRSIDPLDIVRPHFLQNWGWYGMVVPVLPDGTWRQRKPVARATWGNGRCYLGVWKLHCEIVVVYIETFLGSTKSTKVVTFWQDTSPRFFNPGWSVGNILPFYPGIIWNYQLNYHFEVLS